MSHRTENSTGDCQVESKMNIRLLVSLFDMIVDAIDNYN